MSRNAILLRARARPLTGDPVERALIRSRDVKPPGTRSTLKMSPRDLARQPAARETSPERGGKETRNKHLNRI